MKIAILGWGSLVWDPGDLKLDGKWQRSGPELPIELSRQSTNRKHLTYVIDERHKRRVPTRYALSRFEQLDNAIANLACREGCKASDIGYVIVANPEHRAREKVPWEDIATWASDKKLGAVIWTDLPSRFDGDWSLDNAVAFWKAQIPAEALPEAAKYASSAPPEVDTDLRRRLIQEGLIAEHGAVEIADRRTIVARGEPHTFGPQDAELERLKESWWGLETFMREQGDAQV